MNSLLVELLNRSEGDGLEGDVELSFSSIASNDHAESFLKVHSTLLSLASPVLRGAFSSCKSSSTEVAAHKISVDEPMDSWLIVLSRLYPIFPRQELTIELCKKILPIVHKYDISSLLAEALQFLTRDLPAALDHNADSTGYVFTWLQLADDLDLEVMKKMCLRKIRDLARRKLLELAAFMHIPSSSPIAKPNYCLATGSSSVSSQSGHTYGECVKWCAKCRRWGCSKNACPSCSGNPSQNEATATWFMDDQPQLQPAVRGLSKSTLEQVLSIVIAVNSESYVHEERPSASKSSA